MVSGSLGQASAGMRAIAAAAVCVMALVACGTRLDPAEVQARRLQQNGGLFDDPGTFSSGSPEATGSAEPGALPIGPSSAGTGGTVQGPAGSGARGPAVNGPGVSDTEIVIGVSAPLSGILGFTGEETVGPIDAYFKFINSRGGIGGRRLRLISYDDRAEPAQTLSNVKRLVEQDKVFMVFVAFADSPLEYVRQKKIPLITGGVTAGPFSSRYPTVFPLVGNALTFNQEAAFALVNHADVRPERVAILYDTTIFDARGYVPFFEETWERVGAEVVSVDAFNLSDGDCTSLATKMRGLNVQYWDFEGLGWLLCMSAMERIGWRPPLGMGGWPTALPEFGTIVGPDIEGVWTPSTSDKRNGAPRKQTKAHAQYVDIMERFHPSMATPAHLESPNQVAMWSGGRLVVDALNAIAPTFTREAFVDWIQGVRDFDVGIHPPIKSFAPDCKTGAGGTWWAHYEWDDQKEEAVKSPETPYVSGPWADQYGGRCFVTKIADAISNS